MAEEADGIIGEGVMPAGPTLNVVQAVSWRRALAFLVMSFLLYSCLAAVWSEDLSHFLIDVLTVQPAAFLARALSGDPSVIAEGSHIRSQQAVINVLFGCDGTDVALLLLAALLVSPLRWRYRLLGMLAGLALVFVLNQLRVVGLFLALRTEPNWFGPLHSMLAPMLLVLGLGIFYLLWLRRFNRTG